MKNLWSTTAALYAIALSILALASSIWNSASETHRYQFASSTFTDQSVWRGDATTGEVTLCATKIVVENTDGNERLRGMAKRC